MNRVEGLDGFHFYYDSVLNDQIDTVSNFELVSLVDHWHCYFGDDFEAAVSQFLRQAGLVGTLEKAWAKHGMDFHRGIDDRPSDFVHVNGARADWSGHAYCIADFPCVSL